MHAFVAALLAVSAAVPPSEKEVGERVRKLFAGWWQKKMSHSCEIGVIER